MTQDHRKINTCQPLLRIPLTAALHCKDFAQFVDNKNMNTVFENAFTGSLVGDAIAMPVHWYYDTEALDRDYPELDGFVKPNSVHPDSILWRSRYEPLNEDANILHDQAQYWGKRGVHYHQFLEAGENTLNLKLARELYAFVVEKGEYSPEAWLDRYISLMRTPDWHRDTYVEEYHRGFFTNRAKGIRPLECGIDDRHIGGLAAVPALIAALDTIGKLDAETVVSHVRLTHKNAAILEGALSTTRMLLGIASGKGVRDVIAEHAVNEGGAPIFEALSAKPDRVIVGRMLTSACYMPESFAAALALAWKYHDNFRQGVLANALCGGDNCHRGVVVGALLGAANPIPDKWKAQLHGWKQTA